MQSPVFCNLWIFKNRFYYRQILHEASRTIDYSPIAHWRILFPISFKMDQIENLTKSKLLINQLDLKKQQSWQSLDGHLFRTAANYDKKLKLICLWNLANKWSLATWPSARSHSSDLSLAARAPSLADSLTTPHLISWSKIALRGLPEARTTAKPEVKNSSLAMETLHLPPFLRSSSRANSSQDFSWEQFMTFFASHFKTN